MEFESFEFENGIRCIHKRVKSKALHCGLTINTGTRDELKNEHGMAHLIEHMLFKGTTRRKSYHINTLLDNSGGELNAFTSKEETVIQTTTLKSDYKKAIDLITDITFHSTFPPAEMEKEKSVIIDEINSYKDSPSELIFDDFEDLVFSGSSLGRNILGNKQQLKRFRQDDLTSFTKRCYNTDQMVLSVVGDLSVAKIKEVCSNSLGQLPGNLRRFNRALPLPPYTPFNKTVNKNTYQTHSLVGARAYSHQHPHRVPLALLINILGGPSANSRLNASLREKNGLSYNVEAGYSSYSDTGIVSFYFGSDKENTDRCFELFNKELDLVRTQKLTSLQLSRAKKQLIGQLAVSSDSNESTMLSAGKSYMIYNNVESMSTITEKVNAISVESLLEVANEMLSPDQLSVLIYK